MQKNSQFLFIGTVGLLLFGAFFYFNFFHKSVPLNSHQPFTAATPTPPLNRRQNSDTTGQISSLQGPKLYGIQPVDAPIPTPVQKEQTKKINYGMVQFFAPAAPTKPVPTPVLDPTLYLPRATLIPCSLVLTIDSSSRDTPVLAEVTQDVKMYGGTGKVVIPAGTLIAGFASPGRVRDRIEVKGSWDLIFKNGREYEFRGVAANRVYDPNTGRYGLTDGSSGLQGTILYTDRYTELKAFGAAAIQGGVTALQGTTTTNFGNILNRTGQNAGLLGLGRGTDVMIQRYLQANDGDETYVRVPAGKEFYVFSMSVIEPDKASIGAYHQQAKAQTVWERVQSEREQASQADISPELKQMLNGMAKQQRQLDELKKVSSDQPQDVPPRSSF